jgi:aspartate/glutamate racemase
MTSPHDLSGSSDASIGIIMLDTAFPRIPGDIGNPATFPFPVRYEVVRGAFPQRVVLEGAEGLIAPLMDAARCLARKGVKAIAAGCGFLAAFQRELADAVEIPVFSSSLLQVGMAYTAINRRSKVGVLTADSRALTEKHFRGAGIQNIPMEVVGMENAEEFTAVFIKGKTHLDSGKVRKEMILAAEKLSKSGAEIGAIVLECTNMPPYANVVQEVLNVPVFDVVTMIRYVHASIELNRFFDAKE